MTNDPAQISIRFADEFEQELYRLSKKYRNIRVDLEPIIKQLEEGQILGDRLSGFGSDSFIYKLRVRNSNIKKGKSAGYRLIYLLESSTSIVLLAIYTKSEQQDITVNEVNSIINELYKDDQ